MHAILGAFRLFGRLFPGRRLEDLTADSFETLREKYRSRDRAGNIIVPFVFVGIATASYFLLRFVAESGRGEFAASKYLLHPIGFELAIWAGFLSLFSTGAIILFLLRGYLGREEFEIYCAYGARLNHWHFDSRKIFYWFFALFLLPLLAAAVLRGRMFTAFTDKAIVDRPFFSLGAPDRHAYADIRGIYLANGYHARFEDVVEPRYLIVFNDGSRWQTERGSGGSKFDIYRDNMQWVAQQAGKQIRPVAFIEDVPP